MKYTLNRENVQLQLFQPTPPPLVLQTPFAAICLRQSVDYLKGFKNVFTEAGIDGRTLSTLGKAEIMALAEKAPADNAAVHEFYAAVEDLRETGAGVERVLMNDCECLDTVYTVLTPARMVLNVT